MVAANRGPQYDLATRLQKMERQLAALSTQLVGNNLTVSGGTGITVEGGGVISVKDASGNRTVTIGVQPDSTYGMSVTDPISGNTLALSQLAFGLSATTNPGTFTCAGNGVWRTDSADTPLTVEVVTGRLLVTVSAVLFSSVSASNAVMSWSLAGPTTVSPNNQRGLVVATAGYPAAGYSSGSYSYLHTGLTPGSYTITLNYRCDQYGATADSAIAEARTLVAAPY